MFGVNPAMISFMLTSKLDEILSGQIPAGLKLKEKSENKIVLIPEEPEMFEGIQMNSIHVSITYKQTEIILQHG